MKLNHLNLMVTDVEAAVAFLEKYFGLRRQDGDDKFTVMFDDDRLVLSLMKAGQAIKYPGSFHIGFIQESEARVDEINQQLKEDGYDIEAPNDFMPGRSIFKPQADSPSKFLPEDLPYP